MYLEVVATKEDIFEKFMTFLKPVFDLTTNEVKVLAAILLRYKESEGAADKVRWNYVFSTEGRKEVADFAEMNTNQLNLTISSMRKKDVILDDPYTHVKSEYIVDPLKDRQITIIFTISGQEKQTFKPEVQEVYRPDTSTSRDYHTDREEAQFDPGRGYPSMVSTISQHEEENIPKHNQRRDDGYISPEKFSLSNAFPVRKVYTEPEEN